jgi:hypothetical protein
MHCSRTGAQLFAAEMYPQRKHASLYVQVGLLFRSFCISVNQAFCISVQSLRGNPHKDFNFSVLVNYRDCSYPLEIVKVC